MALVDTAKQSYLCAVPVASWGSPTTRHPLHHLVVGLLILAILVGVCWWLVLVDEIEHFSCVFWSFVFSCL